LILGDTCNIRTALASVDSDPEEFLTAETGPCDLLVHYEDFGAGWSEMLISSDIGWDDFREELADNLEIPQRKFRESAMLTWIRGGTSARGKGISISDSKRWSQIMEQLKKQKLQQTEKGKKSVDPTIPNIYIKVTNLKVKSPISTLSNSRIGFY
jgi:hypothetical protein